DVPQLLGPVRLDGRRRPGPALLDLGRAHPGRAGRSDSRTWSVGPTDVAARAIDAGCCHARVRRLQPGLRAVPGPLPVYGADTAGDPAGWRLGGVAAARCTSLGGAAGRPGPGGAERVHAAARTRARVRANRLTC